MFRFLNKSLLVKLLGLAFIAQLFAGFILLYSSQNAVTNFFDDYLEDEIKPIKALVNSALAPLLFAEDIGAATEQVKQMHNSLAKLQYIILKDLDGNILISSGETSSIKNNLKNLENLNALVSNKIYHSTFDITISEEKVGFIHIGINLQAQEILKKSLNYSLILATIAGVLLSALLIGIFTFLTTRRLQELVSKTKEISKGNITKDLHIKTLDEIGSLAKSFNHMQEKLRNLIGGLKKEIKDRKEAEVKLKEYKEHLEELIEEKTIELKNLNENLERKVQEEVYKNYEKDKILSEQAKMVALGEMLGNIAHQWRQPLNAISTAASGLQLYHDTDKLNKKTLREFSNLIIKQAEYLSETIDTFKNFIKDEKVYGNISIQNEISQAISIVETSLNHNFITIEDNIDYKTPIIKMLRKGELSQVIINILNNAKDALLEKAIDNPIIKLDLEKNDNFIIIKIEDNAGGIPLSILPNIFEPYFTTKHKSQGTGLGLYMCYNLVTQGLKGELYVENSSNGAIFYIKIPL